MMTGHLQKLGNLCVTRFTGGLSRAQQNVAATSLTSLVAFSVGVAAATVAVATPPFRLPPILSVAGVAYAALFLEHDRRHSALFPGTDLCELDKYETVCR